MDLNLDITRGALSLREIVNPADRVLTRTSARSKDLIMSKDHFDNNVDCMAVAYGGQSIFKHYSDKLWDVGDEVVSSFKPMPWEETLKSKGATVGFMAIDPNSIKGILFCQIDNFQAFLDLEENRGELVLSWQKFIVAKYQLSARDDLWLENKEWLFKKI